MLLIQKLFIQKAGNLIEELTNDLINKFFSHRRYVIGHGFKVQNREFYPEENKGLKEAA